VRGARLLSPPRVYGRVTLGGVNNLTARLRVHRPPRRPPAVLITTGRAPYLTARKFLGILSA
jgi:hypothetical protein